VKDRERERKRTYIHIYINSYIYIYIYIYTYTYTHIYIYKYPPIYMRTLQQRQRAACGTACCPRLECPAHPSISRYFRRLRAHLDTHCWQNFEKVRISHVDSVHKSEYRNFWSIVATMLSYIYAYIHTYIHIYIYVGNGGGR